MTTSQFFLFYFTKRRIFFSAIVAVGGVFVIIKLHGAHINQTLWAEDGDFFINQARELGISSIWMPYAGYFHLYPRLIAWLSSLFDIQASPFFFFFGWIFAYVALIFVAANKILQNGGNELEAGLLVMLMLAQPHSGEVFFTLTNAQWLIGGALAIYLLVPEKDSLSIPEKALVLMACLTGPFALVLSPILFLQLVIYKDWKARKYIYILIEIGALIQLVGILLSNRLNAGSFHKDHTLCIAALFNFMGFGNKSGIVTATAICFWSATIVGFVLNSDKKLNRHYDSAGTILLSLSAGVVLFFGAGFLADNTNIHPLNPIGFGARYFFIPYLLVFLASWLIVSKQLNLKLLIYACLTILAVFSFTAFKRSDMQFKAYAEFAKNKGNVVIPINPQWPAFPPWQIILPDYEVNFNKKPLISISLNIKNATKLNISVNEKNPASDFQALTKDPQLIFEIGENCSRARYLGVEIDMTRPKAGWLQLFWSDGNHYSEHQSMRRYYPAGEIVAQFAFPKKTLARFDLIR